MEWDPILVGGRGVGKELHDAKSGAACSCPRGLLLPHSMVKAA